MEYAKEENEVVVSDTITKSQLDLFPPSRKPDDRFELHLDTNISNTAENTTMAREQFPDSIEILDFFHLSEYVWAVAKVAYRNQEPSQKDWVKTQQKLLKQSQWRIVIQNCHQLQGKKPDLIKAINNLERYQARGTGGTYWYYKWQSKERIFVTKSGQKSCYQYIGKAGSRSLKFPACT